MKMLAAANPLCLLVLQAMPALDADSSLIAASIHFDSRPQTSTARLQWPAFLFGVHHEVISLLSARAASCAGLPQQLLQVLYNPFCQLRLNDAAKRSHIRNKRRYSQKQRRPTYPGPAGATSPFDPGGWGVAVPARFPEHISGFFPTLT